jgi:ABC-type uncharacterized transport system ATPase subunit
MQSDEAPPLVSMRRIVKRFGDFVANDQIDLDLAAGEIHALLGENGAGKSTLVKMLNGLLQPDEGEILWQGEQIALDTPRDASEIGISMVYQNFSLVDTLTVAENINAAFTDHDRHGFGVRALYDRIIEISEEYDLNLDPNRPVYTLSTGERQRIEIVRALLRHPKLLILDEPTSVLTPQEAESMFQTLTKLSAGGCAILYISHKLEEVQKLCSRATILRNACVVGTCDPKTVDLAELAAMMVGSSVPALRAPALHKIGEVRLQIEALSQDADDPHGVDLQQIHLSVHGGEIVGIAGIAGNGQNELFALLSGEVLAEEPRQIVIDTLPAGLLDIESRRALGAVFIPEERLGHATVPELRLSDNLILSRHGTDDLVHGGLIDIRRAHKLAQDVVLQFDVRAAHRNPVARTLSGGNLQKYIMGREILAQPGIMVVHQPTWGVDAGAAQSIRQALIDLAAQGTAVLVISQDLDELFDLSDRMAVLFAGRLSECLPVQNLSREMIGLMMAGSEVDHAD